MCYSGGVKLNDILRDRVQVGWRVGGEHVLSCVWGVCVWMNCVCVGVRACVRACGRA